MIFARRSSGGPDPFLRRKVHVFFLGAAMGLVGMALGSSLLVGLAILVLMGGVFLRFFSPDGSRREEAASDGEDSREADDLP